MPSEAVPYDLLAADYARHRMVHPGVLRGLVETAALTNNSRVLDVGCGTGNYLRALRSLVGCECWGVEPSQEMLAQARSNNPDATLAQGSAERLDLPTASFDLIFSTDVIHHVSDRAAYFRKAARLLTTGGRFCTMTESPDELAGRRPQSLYFPDTVAVELTRYPSPEQLRAELAETGFGDITDQHVEATYQVTDATSYRAKVYSSMLFISQEAFERGMARMEDDLRRGPIEGFARNTLLWATK